MKYLAKRNSYTWKNKFLIEYNAGKKSFTVVLNRKKIYITWAFWEKNSYLPKKSNGQPLNDQTYYLRQIEANNIKLLTIIFKVGSFNGDR